LAILIVISPEYEIFDIFIAISFVDQTCPDDESHSRTRNTKLAKMLTSLVMFTPRILLGNQYNVPTGASRI
jgi:hypothetical protein